MRYQSLLFPGVFVLAITSLLIVQSCAKNDRADTENERTGIKNDRADTNRNLELSHAHAQALDHIMGYYQINNKSYRDQYRDQFSRNVSTINKWCKLGDRAACDMLSNLQTLDGNMEAAEQITGLIGK